MELSAHMNTSKRIYINLRAFEMQVAVVTVPYITVNAHYDLMVETIDSIKGNSIHTLDMIAIINKAREQDMPWIERAYNYVEHNDVNILARAWNKGIKEAIKRGADYILVPNLDVVARFDTIDDLVRFAEESKKRENNVVLWTATNVGSPDLLFTSQKQNNYGESVDFSFFMVDKTFFDKVGEFDENFIPCYFEDNDMHYRIKQAGYIAYRTLSSLYLHYGSQTLKQDRSLATTVSPLFEKNRKYYEKKWGGSPSNEKYIKPFDGKDGV